MLALLERDAEEDTWLELLPLLVQFKVSSRKTRAVLERGARHAEKRVREQALDTLLQLFPESLSIKAALDLLRRDKSMKVRAIAERHLLRTIKALQSADREAPEDVVPELVNVFPQLPPQLRMPAALALCGGVPRDEKVAEIIIPVLLEGLTVCTKADPSTPGKPRADRGRKKPHSQTGSTRKSEKQEQRDQIIQTFGRLGAPAVGPLVDALEKARGVGVDRANHRVALLRSIQAVGTPAYSEDNLLTLQIFARSDLFEDVRGAAAYALSAVKE